MTALPPDHLKAAHESLPELYISEIKAVSYESPGGKLISRPGQLCVKFPAGISKVPVRLSYDDSPIDYSGIIYTSTQAYLYQQDHKSYLMIEVEEFGQGHTTRYLTHAFCSEGQAENGQITWQPIALPQERPPALTGARKINALEEIRRL